MGLVVLVEVDGDGLFEGFQQAEVLQELNPTQHAAVEMF
jgi:hypothetical protein